MSRAPRFGLLGPLRVLDDAGSPLDLGGLRQRSLLAVLLLEPGRVIPVDRLVALMWGDHPPAKPLANLQSYVSHLRRVLEPDRADRTAPSILGYRGSGYVADVDPDDIDARCFERAAAAGAAALAEGRWTTPGPSSTRGSPCGGDRRCPTWPTSRSRSVQHGGSRT